MADEAVTVVIPAFNAAPFIGDAVESLLSQTLRPAEVLVLDDGSTDDTCAIVERYGPPVALIRQQRAGKSATRNHGLDLARHRYVAFLDADDVSAPTRLERQVAALTARPGAAACFTGHWRFDASGVLESLPAEDELPEDPVVLLANCVVHGVSAMIDREVASSVRYPEGITSAEDVVFTAILATAGPLTVVPEPLYGYREHPAQGSRKNHPGPDAYPFFEQRYRWALDNAPRLWPERDWREVELALWNGLAKQTEASYWARHRRFFLQDRDYIRRRWPAHLSYPAVARWRWYPDWLWKAKDWVDRRRRVSSTT